LTFVTADDGIWPREKRALAAAPLPPDYERRLPVSLRDLDDLALTVRQHRRMAADHDAISNLCTHSAHSLGFSPRSMVDP
jgi:hypothetical protein